MKSNYVARARKFMNQFLTFSGDFNMKDAGLVRMKVKEFNKKYNRKVIVSTGATRIVLITADYVIKWDYDKEWVGRVGGCEKEVENYKFAVSEGMAHLFAKVTPFTMWAGTFYVAPRIQRIGREKHHYKMLEDFLTIDERMWVYSHIGDLHHGNWGIVNNKAAIIDYSSRIR